MLKFAKAHACGNDFLIVEQSAEQDAESLRMNAESMQMEDAEQRALAVALCARTTGVGADGVEFLAWTGEGSATIRLRNADGGVAEISGNGTRCAAAWMAHSKDAAVGDAFHLLTDAGERICILEARDGANMRLRSAMGVPTVEQAAIALDEDALLIEGAIVSTGNPHFVVRVDDDSFTVRGMDWQTLGSALCFHPQFPAQTNVEFVHVLSPACIAIRIFERGVGPTSSSGTGTCASAAAAIALYGCARTLEVHAPGGMQSVTWPADSAEMELTGPAVLVAQGSLLGPLA